MTRRTRIRVPIERASAPSRRYATCDVHCHSNTQTRTRGSECTLIRTKTRTHVTVVYYRTVQCDLAGYYRPWDPRRPEIGPDMAQSHEDRERSRRECGSCGHPDHRLVAARAVRVAYGYARAPLLPPDPRQPDHATITVADEAEQATKEEAPEVNRGECTHTHRRPIVARAARTADGYAGAPPLLARRPQCPPPASPTAGAGDHGPPRRRRSGPRTLPTLPPRR